MKTSRIVVLFSLSIILLVSGANADPQVAGNVFVVEPELGEGPNDLLVENQSQNFTIVGDAEIPEGTRLNIHHNINDVVIWINAGVTLTIKGELDCSHVQFIKNQNDSWESLIFENEGECFIHHGEIKEGGLTGLSSCPMITINESCNGTVVLDEIVFHESDGSGVGIYESDEEIRVQNCIFWNLGQNGINISGNGDGPLNVSLLGTSICNNGGTGIYISTGARAFIRNCRIYNHEQNDNIAVVSDDFQLEIWNTLFAGLVEDPSQFAGINVTNLENTDESYLNVFFCHFDGLASGIHLNIGEDVNADIILDSRFIAGVDELGISNNIFSNCEDGLSITGAFTDQANHELGYNAFKDIENDESDLDLNMETCKIDGVGNNYFGWSTRTGYGNVTFPDRLTGQLGRPLNSFNALVNAGNPNIEEFNDPVIVSNGDFGIFGGQFARQNILFENVTIPDQILITPHDPEVAIDWNNYTPPPDDEYYNIPFPGLRIEANQVASFGAGCIIDVDPDAVIEIEGEFKVEGTSGNPTVFVCTDPSETWGGIVYDDPVGLDDCILDYCQIGNAAYGIKLIDCNDSYGNRVTIEDCTIQDCGVGVYANNSRLALTNCTITGSTGTATGGAGVYLTNCASGKVLIDGCSITDNGIGETVSSPGIYLSSSSPEIINTTIEDNSGAGITCYGSSPDLYTQKSGVNNPNDIRSNGGLTQAGSDGAEIYLMSSSYPPTSYNNIVDFGSGPIGKMIYKDATYNTGGLTAKNNYWGATPSDAFFFWGSGTSIIYSNYWSTEISSAERFDFAMGLWDEGEFAACAEVLQECIYDTGSVGVNSVHYLSGCVGQMRAEERQGQDRQGRLSSYAGLREYLQEVVGEHEDATVARVANRFATDCLTQLGEYDEALEEFDYARAHAGNISDSVMAVIDYLAVYELANGHEANSSGKSVPALMGEAFAALEKGRQTGMSILPEDFAIEAAYPNPFNSTTRFGFALPEAANVKVTVHDLTGRQVAELASGRLEAGSHTAVWSAEGASAGLYFCKVVAGGQTATTKVMLVK